MNEISQYLLEGSYYALVQCGKLLTSAAILYNAGDCATAVALAAFAREELGKSCYLRDQRKKVVAGKTVSIKAIKADCENHVMKQKWSQLIEDYKLTSKSAAAKVFPILMNPESTECQEALQLLEVVIKKKKGHTSAGSHEERMCSLYVDPNENGRDWNKPWEKNKELAKQFIHKAINEYSFLRKRLELNVLRSNDPELAQSIETWGARPFIPPPPCLT